MVLLLGVDDSGRGPVIGPMILAGCLIDEETEKEFKRLGVKDSKQLTQKRREFLETLIKEKAIDFHVISISPDEIDQKGKEGIKLNEVEALAAAEIINKINSASNAGSSKIRVVLDCPSVNRTAWRNTVMMKVDNLSNLEIICEHKADVNHVAVSAASVLAKCQREKEMSELKEKYGKEIGSGYSSDPVTKKFLAKNLKKHDNKGIFRKSWKTWKKANNNLGQKKLF